MLIEYVPKKFTADHQSVIDQANEIITDYQEQGYDLTLRQLYYQFVARDLIPNTERSYKRIGNIINDGRLAGQVSWKAIIDRTRNLMVWPSHDSPREALQEAADNYAEDMWADQPTYCEVWVEKEALAGVISSICYRHNVPYFSCRGYVSQSELWAAGMRLKRRIEQGGHDDIVIFHLGDHDPSGIDMTRDNLDRILMFAGHETRIEVRRLALNRDQIDEYNPPPNPAKVTDSRAKKYIATHGDSSWELDALEPSVISKLIGDNVDELKHWDIWDASNERESENERKIRSFMDQLDD